MSGLRILLTGVIVSAGCAKGHEGGDDPDGSGHSDIDGPGGVIDAGDEIDAPGHIDAPPGTPDSPPTPDATPPPPDATVCTVQQVQRLLNQNLDGTPTGNNWAQFPFDAGFPLITTPPTGLPAVTPPNVAWLGGFLSASDRMYQEITISPTTTAVELRGSRFIGTEEDPGTAYDHVYIEVTSPTDVVLATLVHWTNNDSNTGTAFPAFTLPLPSAFAGQTIRISFRSTTDSSLNTNFFFDSLRLFVTDCL